jgi:hypothetical protein
VYLVPIQWSVFEQRFAQVGEVTIGISGRGHALIDLKKVHLLPRDIFRSERLQHDPRSVAAAYGKAEAASQSDRGARVGGDRHSPGSGDGIGIIKYFEFHWSSSHEENVAISNPRV